MFETPRLRKVGQTWELLVDNEPYLILGAELQNSSLSCRRYMDTVWQKIADLGVNTVLAPISWEDIEPEEGIFDFSELDVVLEAARSYHLRLILTWFGAFKNGTSCYVPSWVNKSPTRFPRMKINASNRSLEVINNVSIFHGECVKADARAFATFMKYLKYRDEAKTVIMVQVENEVGILGDSRDRSVFADKAFRSPVPEELRQIRTCKPLSSHSNTLGQYSALGDSWEAFFGQSNETDEAFMAYHFALYVEEVASAGKQAYNIPMFTNAWLPLPRKDGSGDNVASGGGKPGEYPSGGPVPAVLDIWRRFAPTLDLLCPDIYTTDYTDTCADYSSRRWPLFIPEQRRDGYGARRLWEAIGRFKALGTSPFGIDTVDFEACPLKLHYTLLGKMSVPILKARLKPETLFGFYFDDCPIDTQDHLCPIVRRFEPYELTISREFVFGKPKPGFGIVIQLEPHRFLLIGSGFKVQFMATSPTATYTGILRVEEKSVLDPRKGILRTERKLNGDETRSGKWVNMPSESPDSGDSCVPITIPARTMIAEVEVYWLEETDTNTMEERSL